MPRPFDLPKVKRENNEPPENEDKATSLHILFLAKQIGIPINELKQLTMGEFLTLLELHTQSLKVTEEKKVRDATQADIDAFLH